MLRDSPSTSSVEGTGRAEFCTSYGCPQYALRAAGPHLRRWNERVRAGLRQVATRGKPAGDYATAALTRILTDLVMQWGANDETGAWSSFFELVPPFIPSTGSVCGNLDVVLTRPGSRDMVVEIDSTDKERSMEKLRFAHRVGATAVWIRWCQGAVRKVPGVHVIDLVADTRKTRRRTPAST